MKIKPILAPMDRPPYKTNMAMRIAQALAGKAEPKLAPLNARAKDGWVYGQPKPRR